MNIAITIVTILIAWKWADWKNWQKYHTTMLYVMVGDLLYKVLYHNHFLWQFKDDLLLNSNIIGLLYTFIVLPLTVLIFLSYYPDKMKRQIIYNLLYITLYFIFEWLSIRFGMFKHNYGWNIWWSLAWDCMMFPMIALHHKRPLMAYGASVLAVTTMLILFPVVF